MKPAHRVRSGLLVILLGGLLLYGTHVARHDLGRAQKITLRITGALLILSGSGLLFTAAPGRK